MTRRYNNIDKKRQERDRAMPAPGRPEDWDVVLRRHFDYPNVYGKRRLYDVIKSLPQSRRQLITQRFGIGDGGDTTVVPMNMQEIAEQRGITRQSVGKELERAKTQLATGVAFIQSGGILYGSSEDNN